MEQELYRSPEQNPNESAHALAAALSFTQNLPAEVTEAITEIPFESHSRDFQRLQIPAWITERYISDIKIVPEVPASLSSLDRVKFADAPKHSFYNPYDRVLFLHEDLSPINREWVIVRTVAKIIGGDSHLLIAACLYPENLTVDEYVRAQKILARAETFV